jgi:DNA modification methylase
MKKEITKANRKRLDSLVNALEGVENSVPHVFKRVFNFKGRKSPNIAKIAIETLTEQGDIVFDPFMGSGAFVIAAAQAGRKIVATEIDNYTYAAVFTLLAAVDGEKLCLMFDKVEAKAKAAVISLYETECCGAKNYISKLLYDPETQEYYDPTPNREIVDGKNVKLVFPCPICGGRKKKFALIDEQKLASLNDEDVSAFPQARYIENSRINITKSTGADYYDRIFTRRSQKALLLIQEAILTLPPCIERDVIEHALVSTLTLARVAMYGSSSDILYHVVPRGAQESNVWELFESKVDSFINFKSSYAPLLAADPSKDDKYQILLTPCQKYCESRRNKPPFDLIYTDFPYTDQVPYLERNQMYRVWLDTFYKKGAFSLTREMLDLEIVQTNAPARAQKQDIKVYYAALDQMFAHFYNILKPAGLAVLTVKLGKAKYFQTLMEIINLARKNGFEYALRFGIDKNDPSLRKQSAYKNTLANEMIVAFERLEDNTRYWYVGTHNYEFATVRIVYQLISKSAEDTSLSGAVKAVKDTLRKKQNYFATETDLNRIQAIIKENYAVDNNSVVRIDPNKLYLDIEDKTDLFTKFYEYIPVIIGRLLDNKGKFVLDDLYFEIANTLCNGDPGTIRQFLEDTNHQANITKLLRNYCLEAGKVYEKRDYGQNVSEAAIDISTLEGAEFEEVIKRLLIAEGYFDVIRMGGAGDLGVDLLAKKMVDGVICRFLFQCKRWASDVGSEPMQRLVSERARRGADFAICAATSGYTRDGLLISEQQNIEAWNGEEVMRRLNLQFPDEYFNGALNH